MLSIISRAMNTATRVDHWDAPHHFRKPVNERQARQIVAQRRLSQMRDVGRW